MQNNEFVSVEQLAEERLGKELLEAIKSVEIATELKISPNQVNFTARIQGKRLGQLMALLAAILTAYLKYRQII